VEDSLVNAIYDRMKEEVDVSHIMIASRGAEINPAEQKTRLDSIRNAIIAGADFEQLARRFSIDRSVIRNGGHMGYITATKFPYTFEDAAYTTPVGQISPVIETPFGYHIVKVHNRRPADKSWWNTSSNSRKVFPKRKLRQKKPRLTP
jgi:peptidyl-prolyl cis-trans isomerase SurA